MLAVGASALTSCGGKKTDNKTQIPGQITFWSSFGNTYKNALDTVVAKAKTNTGVDITHISKGSYPEIKRAMLSAINVGQAPNLAMGYPDHFAEYIGNDALVPLEDYIKGSDRDDYYKDYLDENWFYSEGEQHLYGVPFNKSTEVLGYNGTFVSYCATINPELANVPQTWQEWAVQGPKYMTIYNDLINNNYILFGRQRVDGSTYDFEKRAKLSTDSTVGDDLVAEDGKIALLDFTKFSTTEKKAKTRLMSWDATDNAFITLIKQWGAEYTELPKDQREEHAFYQVGKVKFGSATNLPKVVECLKFFNRLAQDRIFGIPAQLNSDYSSEAFAEGSCMFMVCSSGGLSYNTKTWHSRFTVAPIPYYDDGVNVRKEVISQGANICMPDTGNYEESIKVMKELTTKSTQVDWCLKTGYYPCSKSAAESKEYQDFIDEAKPASIQKYAEDWVAANPDEGKTVDEVKAAREVEVYSKPSRVAYREGSDVNQKYYMNSSAGWHKFVDAAFVGSSAVRETVENVLKIVFTEIQDSNVEDSSKYEKIIKNTILKDKNIANSENIEVEK